MQYWIFYEPSMGGRNFARLLENADNMHTADGFTGFRSKSLAKNNYDAASWASLNGVGCSPFIDPVDTSDSTIQLHSTYQSIIANNQNTVLLAHYRYFDEIDNFVYKNLLEQNQVKINIFTDENDDSTANKVYAQQLYNNYYRQNYGVETNLKNLEELVNEADPDQKQVWIDQFKSRLYSNKNSNQFDLQLDGDLIFNHYNYVSTQLQTIGITISEEKWTDWKAAFV